MAARQYDGVIEAVRYTPEGRIELVRAYERRGATYSDRVLLDRNTLVERMKRGKRFAVGQRKELWASTFQSTKPVRYIRDKDVITSNERSPERDAVEAPLF